MPPPPRQRISTMLTAMLLIFLILTTEDARPNDDSQLKDLAEKLQNRIETNYTVEAFKVFTIDEQRRNSVFHANITAFYSARSSTQTHRFHIFSNSTTSPSLNFIHGTLLLSSVEYDIAGFHSVDTGYAYLLFARELRLGMVDELIRLIPSQSLQVDAYHALTERRRIQLENVQQSLSDRRPSRFVSESRVFGVNCLYFSQLTLDSLNYTNMEVLEYERELYQLRGISTVSLPPIRLNGTVLSVANLTAMDFQFKYYNDTLSKNSKENNTTETFMRKPEACPEPFVIDGVGIPSLKLKEKLARFYALIFLLSLLEVFLTSNQLRADVHMNTSFIPILIICWIDCFFCMSALPFALIHKTTPVFMAVLFIKLFQMLLFDFRFMASVLNLGTAQMNRFYAQFYVSMVVMIFLTALNTFLLNIVVFFCCLAWIPQIRLNTRNQSSSLTLPFVIGISASKLFVIAYIYGCPSNVYTSPTNPLYLLFLFTLVIAQIAILTTQKLAGSRWIFYKLFGAKFCERHVFGQQYIYGVRDGTCVICMNDGECITTPCNHTFHHECLQEWMNRRMHCPVCRSDLPILTAL